MSARSIPNGQTVTLKLDADQLMLLKVEALQSKWGLSEIVGTLLSQAIKAGGLEQFRNQVSSYAPQLPEPPKAKPSQARSKAPTKESGTKGERLDMAARIHAYVAAKKVSRTEVVEAITPGRQVENYQSWKNSGIPAAAMDTARLYLGGLVRDHGEIESASGKSIGAPSSSDDGTMTEQHS